MMYHLPTLLISTIAFTSGLCVLGQVDTTLSYDVHYGDPTFPLNGVACSDGDNGLESKNPNWQNLGDLPNFPYVGAFESVAGWDSTACGTCYAVTYGGTTVDILAVDKSSDGIIVSQQAMDALTGNQAVVDGRVSVSVELSSSNCGIQ